VETIELIGADGVLTLTGVPVAGGVVAVDELALWLRYQK
jgi:hypothetical protein